jgi:hypothetical protein
MVHGSWFMVHGSWFMVHGAKGGGRSQDIGNTFGSGHR